jgi:hypothetical protein
MKFKVIIEIDSDNNEVLIFDEESGRAYEMGSVMILAGGPTKRGNNSSCMLTYGNSNVLADIVEDHVFRTAVEKSWNEHILFDKIYYGILAGKFLCKIRGIPLELPCHPHELDPETLLEMLEELEREKREEEKEEIKKKFTLHVNRDADIKRH